MKVKTALSLAVCCGVAVLFLGSVRAEGTHVPAAEWFNETYQNFRVDRVDKWTDAAGVWRKENDRDKSVFSNATQNVHLDTRGRELQFTPNTSPANKKYQYNALMTLNTRMTFTACQQGEEWSITNFSQHAAIALRMKSDGESFTFIGWVSTRDGSNIKGRWLELAADGLAPEENRFYDVRIESDYSCVPTRIRYSVDSHVLRDTLGNEWFSTRSSLYPDVAQKKHATKVGFRGRGIVGEIHATQATNRAERATIALNAGARPQTGSEISFSATAKNGATLSGDLTGTWYLMDAAGMRIEPSIGTGATYTLQAGDVGHWVTVDVADANGYAGTGKFWCSDLPVVEMSVGSADGFVKTDDEVAAVGETYYWADEGDNFHALEIAEGTDLEPYREQYENLFVETLSTEWPSSKKETHSGKITIRGNAEYPDQIENMKFTIHVRGNSTAGQDKKPYKIKLDKKTDLFGLGGGVKNKHWVLLANCFDESLMRNKLCYDLSGVFGAPVWMKSEWVDVVMNGQYVGNYQLCQHIRVGEERVPVFEWDTGKVAEQTVEANPEGLTDDDTDIIDEMLETNCLWMTSGTFAYKGVSYTLTAKKDQGGAEAPNGGIYVYWKAWPKGDIAGGYLFEIDSKKMPGKENPAPSAMVQNNVGAKGTLSLNVALNTPEFGFTNPAVSNFVWNTWWNLGQAWLSGTGYNGNGQHYTELADFDSMVAYWLSMYVPGNDDAAAFSRYSYLDFGGKMTFGPAWDFDYGLGSLQIRIRSAAITNEYGEATYAPIAPEKWIPGNGSGNFIGYWTSDPYFSFKARERYLATRSYLADMVKDGGLIDQYKVKLAASARANDLRWNNRIGFFGNAEETGDADSLKEFLARRFAWFDQKFATVGDTVTNITATVNNSGLRYARNASLAPTFEGATPNADTIERNVADVKTVLKNAPLSGTLVVPSSLNATKIDVYVNGLSNATVAVASGAADIDIPASALLTSGTNFISFIARKSDGAEVAKNFALVATSLPDTTAAADNGHEVPLAWLADAWTSISAVDADAAGDQPVSYADYLAFELQAPLGKPMALWQEYVAGTEPTDEGDVFRANIAVDADGAARISWTPDRPKLRATRDYTLYGAPRLGDTWATTDAQHPAARFGETNRFFKVGVQLSR